MSEQQLTLLPEIYEIDTKKENEIHAIYIDKRSKGWSPTSACLMASILTDVPECYVQQLIRFKLNSKISENAFEIYCSSFKDGIPYGTFYNEDSQAMVGYFEQMNIEKSSSWRFDEFRHQRKLAKELNVKMQLKKWKQVRKWDHESHGRPQPLEVARCFNFYVMKHYGPHGSSEAVKKLAQRFERSDEGILELLERYVILTTQDHVFVNHCQAMSKLISEKSHQDVPVETIRNKALVVIIERSLPIPIHECWIENNRYDFEYYCANIFWQEVYDECIFKYDFDKAQGNQMIRNESAFNILSSVIKSPNICAQCIPGYEERKREFTNAMVGQTVVTSYDKVFHKIIGVNYISNPNTVVLLQENGKPIQLVEFLKQEYGLITKNLMQPLLVSYSKTFLVPEHCLMTNLTKDSDRRATRSVFENVVTRVAFTCSRCVVLPNDRDQGHGQKHKLFETFSSLKSHNEFYHNYEYKTSHPDLVFQISEEQMRSDEFRICHHCQKLSVTLESHLQHLRLDHDPKKAEMATDFLAKSLECNKDKVDRKVQRAKLVKDIMKHRHDFATKQENTDKSSVWKTEGDPEAYDIDKVLKELNEDSSTDATKLSSKKPNKKKKKARNQQNRTNATDLSQNMECLNIHDPIQSKEDLTTTETEESIKGFGTNLDSSDVTEDIVDGAAGGAIAAVSEYIDSIEEENRCFKTSQSFFEGLQQENERLKARLKKKEKHVPQPRLCAICLEKEPEITFLPCGHFVTCVNCAPCNKNCPICRKPIRGSVRTYC